MPELNVAAIVEEAFEAAREASRKFYEAHGERDCCGFAWVVVKPANSKVAKYLKEHYQAGKHYHGGISVWNPGGVNTQAMTIKEEGAYAFADVLQKYGVKAYAGSRMD